MPHRLAVRLGLVPGLVLVALFFASTAGVQQRKDASPAELSAEGGGPDEDESVVVNNDLISFKVTVTDKFGRCVNGLPQSAFTVFDEKRSQEISFFGEDDSPISVGIVFDLTGSMREGKVLHAREALARFMETSHRDDEYYLVTLQNGGASLSMGGTRDHEAVLNMITGAKPRGGTAFYDGCYLGLGKVLRGTHARRALLLISDGQDNRSLHTSEELHALLKESDVIIYSIGVAEKENEYLTLPGEEALRDMAEVTGGKFFQPRSDEEMYEVFERIALELRRQYAIAYRPSNFTTDGKWHRLKVKLAPPSGLPRLFVRYRGGYYARQNPRRVRAEEGRPGR